MNGRMLPEYSRQITLRAEKWVNNGYCLGYFDEETYFISGAIPGELVECEPVTITKKFKQVKAVRVIEASSERTQSDCDIFLLCGGCSFRHISYSNELEIKKNLFLNEFNHKFPDSKIEPNSIQILRGHELHYRNNVQLKIQNNKKGFFKSGTNELVEFPKTGCLNLPEELNHYIKNLKPGLKSERKLRLTDSVFDYSENESEFKIADKKLIVPQNGFFQINRFLIQKWLEEIIDFIPEANLDILELFSGSGLISLFISPYSKKIVGYELESNAVSYSKKNKELNKISNLEFYCKNLYSEKISQKHLEFPLWVMNPPRNGLGNLIVEQILTNRPKYIVYSSCNYISLIQDLKKIKNLYDVRKTTIADFFPRTPYFETLILLEKI